jgi:isoaspartyl peptidase/L-asparaginase-like protein (Ntn-hydrolase superfamily)
MFAIAIHGGAGVRPKNEITEKEEKQYFEGLEEALDSGYQVFAQKGHRCGADSCHFAWSAS